METYPNAPLLAIKARIWWHIYSFEDARKSTFIPGDFYSKIKEDWPVRDFKSSNSIQGILSSNSSAQFKLSENEKNGVIELNSESVTISHTSESYSWDSFYPKTKKVITGIIEVLNDLMEPDHIHLSLDYQNFVKFDYKNENIIEFLSNNLNTTIQQEYLDFNNNFANKFDMKLKYEVQENIDLSIEISTGKHNDERGIFIRYIADSKKEPTDIEKSFRWMQDSHEICDNVFKKMHNKLLDSYS